MSAPRRTLIYIAYIWPERRSSAAGLRVWDVITGLRSQGWEVTVASQGGNEAPRLELEEANFKTQKIELNHESFDEWVKELGPRVVIFERFLSEEQWGARVRKAAPQALTIVDTSDLQSLRQVRALRQKSGRTTQGEQWTDLDEEERKLVVREVASLLRSDWTWLVSQFEAQWLGQFIDPTRASLVRIGYPDLKGLEELPSFDDRKNLVMIGNFLHAPNADAVTWFSKEVWPRMRGVLAERANEPVELHVYGAYPTREMMQLDSPKTGFRIMGWATDQYQTLAQYRVSVAPLRFGAGIKGKILDSWWTGTPVVSTAIGFEGMFEGETRPPEDLVAPVVGDDVSALWAAQIASIYCDKKNWSQIQSFGREQIKHGYLGKEIWNKIAGELEARLAVQVQTRSQSFLQTLLWHETLRSSEYFSRWIEAKNRPV